MVIFRMLQNIYLKRRRVKYELNEKLKFLFKILLLEIL